MKKKRRHIRPARLLDPTAFLLLAFVVLALLTFFAWQAGMLPPLITRSILGISTPR